MRKPGTEETKNRGIRAPGFLWFVAPILLVWLAASRSRGWLHRAGDAARANGALVSAEPEFTLRLRSVDGLREVEGRGGRAKLPAGRYWLEGWSARRRDAGGHRWEISRAPGEPSREITVRAGSDTSLPLAAPVTAELVIGQSGRDVSLRLRLKGGGQETLGAVREDGRRLPPPALRIEDARGRLLARLQGDDTCGAGCAMLWHAPRGAAQPLRAVPEAQLGPFPFARAAFQFRLNDRSPPSATLDSASP